MITRQSRRAFTLIELLVVIAIISLLTSIVLASLQSAREKAIAVRTVQELKQIELALRMWVGDQYNGQWPKTTELPLSGYGVEDGNHLPISQLMTTNFKNYLPADINPLIGEKYTYYYQNTWEGCGSSVWFGANISIRKSTLSLYKKLDQIIDKTDGKTEFDYASDYPGNRDYKCGRIRYNCSQEPCSGSEFSIYYMLGVDAQDFY